MKFLVLALALAACPAMAAKPRTYALELDFSIAHKKVMSPKLLVQEGQQAEVEEKGDEKKPGAFLGVTASRPKGGADNQIQLSFTLGKVEGGKRTVLGQPQIVLLENESAGMTMAEAGQPDLEINAVVKRQP